MLVSFKFKLKKNSQHINKNSRMKILFLLLIFSIGIWAANLPIENYLDENDALLNRTSRQVGSPKQQKAYQASFGYVGQKIYESVAGGKTNFMLLLLF